MKTTKEKVNEFNIPHLNIVKAVDSDFQDEFMSRYDEFSKSWRDACDEINNRKLN